MPATRLATCMLVLCLQVLAQQLDCPQRLFSRGFAGDSQEWPEVADVDGDGDADLLTFTPSGKVYVAVNEDGQRCHGGRVWARDAFAAGAQAVVGDFDGNGRAGFAVLLPDGALLLGRPGPDSFAVSTQGALGTGRLLAGDINADGLCDLVLAGDSLALYLSRGEAGFAAPRGWTRLPTSALICGRLDAQPGADLLTVIDGRFLLASGGSEPGPWQDWGDAPAAPRMAIDLDGADRDAVLAGSWLLRPHQSGFVAWPMGLQLPASPAVVRAGDADGDGGGELFLFERKGGRVSLARPSAGQFAAWECWGELPQPAASPPRVESRALQTAVWRLELGDHWNLQPRAAPLAGPRMLGRLVTRAGAGRLSVAADGSLRACSDAPEPGWNMLLGQISAECQPLGVAADGSFWLADPAGAGWRIDAGLRLEPWPLPPGVHAGGDFNADGWPDVVVASDAGLQPCYWLPELQRFEPAGPALGQHGLELLAAVDWSADGWPDLIALDRRGQVMVARGSARQDADGDLLGDLDERRSWGTDPHAWDSDRDGLADGWEARGLFRGQRIDLLGADPLRRTLLLELDVDQGADMGKVQKAIARLEKLYAGCPTPNPDGSLGIDAIVVVDTRVPRGSDMPSRNRHQLREQYFSPERAGIFHWMHLSAQGGGGQANLMSDHGSCGGVFEATLPHELGHQLSLRHGGGTSRNSIPHYPSLMNYAYNYALDGKLDNIDYSRGHLASISFDEYALAELVDVPYAALRYLSNRPFHFPVEAVGDGQTWIDWNLDGVQNSAPVAANINWASGEGYGKRSFIDDEDAHELHTASRHDPLVLDVGGRLVVLSIPPDSQGIGLRSFSHEAGWSASRQLHPQPCASHLTGAALGERIELFGNLPGGGIGHWRGELDSSFVLLGSLPGSQDMWASAAGRGSGDSAELFLMLAHSTAIHADSNGQAPPWVPASDSSGTTLRVRRGGDWQEVAFPTLRSGVPLGLAIDERAGQLLCAGTLRASQGRMHLWRIDLSSLELVADEPVGGSQGKDATSCRPAVVLQSGPGLPEQGRINIYHAGRFKPGDPNSYHMWRSFTIGDKTWRGREGWKQEQMFNQWSYSNAGPGAALHAGKPVVITRFWTHYSSKTRNDALCVAFDGDGIVDRSLRDHDDWAAICDRGLEQSILIVHRPRGRP